MGAIPTRQLSLQPVAIEAAVEVTILPKLSMERIVQRSREQAGRNVRTRRAGLENSKVGADPSMSRGRPLSSVPGERLDPTDESTGVVATACLYTETRRNTGDPAGGRVTQLDAREGQARPAGEAERSIVPSKPGKAGHGKGSQFKVNGRSGHSREIGDEPNTSTR